MKFIDPGFKGKNPGHYSTAVVSNGMLYVSGLLSMDPDTREVCTGDIEAHAAQALQNLDRVLQAAGRAQSSGFLPRLYPVKRILGAHQCCIRPVFWRTQTRPGCRFDYSASLRLPR